MCFTATFCCKDSGSALHKSKKSAIPAISNDYLPSASTVSGYFKEQGMKVLQQIDNTEMFVVLAQKIVAKAREPYLRVPATFDPCRGDL
jgi:hypothetical protein